MPKPIIAVIGGAEATAPHLAHAEEIGRLLAQSDCITLTGGLEGVMSAASRGAKNAGGLVVGIVPGHAANPYVDIVIRTEMGDARNAIIANSADAFIAIGGSYGTLSEIAFALKRGKTVVGLETWSIEGVLPAHTPEEAVVLARKNPI